MSVLCRDWYVALCKGNIWSTSEIFHFSSQKWGSMEKIGSRLQMVDSLLCLFHVHFRMLHYMLKYNSVAKGMLLNFLNHLSLCLYFEKDTMKRGRTNSTCSLRVHYIFPLLSSSFLSCSFRSLKWIVKRLPCMNQRHIPKERSRHVCSWSWPRGSMITVIMIWGTLLKSPGMVKQIMNPWEFGLFGWQWSRHSDMIFTGRQPSWSDKIPQVQGNAKTRFLWACSSGLSRLTCRWGWGAGALGWGWTSQPQSAHPPDGEPWGEPQRQGRPRSSALPSSTAANGLENPIKVFSPGQLPPPSKNPVPTDALIHLKGGRRDGG